MWTNPWTWVALTVFLLALSVVGFVGIVAMRRRAARRRMADPVEGKLTVTAVNMPGQQAMFSNYRLHGVITAPGVPATAVDQRGIAQVKKWPLPNREFAVLVDRADPTRFQILWDRVSTGRQVASEQAQRLAQSMRGDSYTSAPIRGTATHSARLATDGQADAIAAAVRESLSKMGMNPDQVNVRATAAAAAVGEQATAVVVGVRDVPGPAGQPAPAGGAVELTLDVTRADGSRHTATAGVLFSSPQRRTQFGAIGTRLPVRLDPADPSRATIDYGALDLS